MKYLRTLREWIQKHSSQDIVYFDESGFAEHSYRPHGWARRGVKVHGKVHGNNRKRTNLIMAQRGKEWLAPMLFEKSGIIKKTGGCFWFICYKNQLFVGYYKMPKFKIVQNAVNQA